MPNRLARKTANFAGKTNSQPSTPSLQQTLAKAKSLQQMEAKAQADADADADAWNDQVPAEPSQEPTQEPTPSTSKALENPATIKVCILGD